MHYDMRLVVSMRVNRSELMIAVGDVKPDSSANSIDFYLLVRDFDPCLHVLRPERI